MTHALCICCTDRCCKAYKAVNLLQRGWQVKGDSVYFDQQAQDDLKDVPALELMNHTLTYARELERIV